MTAHRTFRKPSLMLGVAACTLLLASCGGNNQNNPTPTPTPTTTATPTPTPTGPVADINFANDFAFGSVQLYIYAYFTPTGGMQVFNDANRLANSTGGLSYEVSPENVIFAFTDLNDNVVFDASTLVSGTDTLRLYETGDEKLKLELPYGNVLRATYSRVDSDIAGVDPGVLASNRVLFLFDAVTTTDAITTGLTWAGTPQVIGGTPGATAPDAITATASNFTIAQITLTASDGTTTTVNGVTGTIQIFADVNGTPTLVTEIEVEVPISTGDSFGGAVSDANDDFTGALTGTLAGANREEIVFIFSVSHTDGRKFVGSFIGEQPAIP